MRRPSDLKIPLFPLPNLVHFPGTDLKLHIFEPRYRRLVEDLMEASPEARLIGMVLIKPGSIAESPPEIFPEGTAGLLMDVDFLPDGRSNIVLHGDFRFAVERELDAKPYRRALVRPLAEPQLNERDAGVVAVRRELVDLVNGLGQELGDRFPFASGELAEASDGLRFEQLVNRIAAELDLPAVAKVHLLADTLPDRAMSLLSILRSRRRVLEVLRPFRHLAQNPDLN